MRVADPGLAGSKRERRSCTDELEFVEGEGIDWIVAGIPHEEGEPDEKAGCKGCCCCCC